MEGEYLNRLASLIIKIFQEKCDSQYVANKVATLQGQNMFETLLWCHSLDTNNQRELAALIGVSESDFKVTLKVIKKLAN